jgi:putative oxidoreductase
MSRISAIQILGGLLALEARLTRFVEYRFPRRLVREDCRGINGGCMHRSSSLVFLTGNERFADVGLLLLRVATGAFLIFQSHDNVFSNARMNEFEDFMRQFGFIYPELLAPLSVYAQFAAGICFILGIFTRWFGLITAFNFLVAMWMVHWADSVPQMWPAAVLVVLGLYLGLRGSGRFGIDAAFEGRSKSRHN